MQIVRSLIAPKNFSGFLLFITSVTSLYLALILSSATLAAESLNKLTTDSTIADDVEPAKTTSEKEELGMESWLSQERIIFLSQAIDAEIAETVVARLLYLDHKAPGKDIHLYINSPGGEITSGLAIYDTLRSLRSNVVTVGLGEVSSMASLLLAGGTKGKRVALPSARIMIHQPWTGGVGQASDIAIIAKEILYHRTFLNRLLSELTGQPLKRIEVDTDRNFYMSAQEAKAYGLVDRVLKQTPSGSRPLKN